MAISAGDFRTGLTLIVDGDPWQVLDFQHVKPGKGAAILKTKMKNLKTGNTQERNFNASTKFEQANISKKSAQFSYEADATYYFMDMETFDTYELSEDQIGFNNASVFRYAPSLVPRFSRRTATRNLGPRPLRRINPDSGRTAKPAYSPQKNI